MNKIVVIFAIGVLFNVQFATSDLLDGLEHHDHHHHDHHDDHEHHDHHDHQNTADIEDFPLGVTQFLPNEDNPSHGARSIQDFELAMQELAALDFGEPFSEEELEENSVPENPQLHLVPIAPPGQSESFESLFNIPEDNQPSQEIFVDINPAIDELSVPLSGSQFTVPDSFREVSEQSSTNQPGRPLPDLSTDPLLDSGKLDYDDTLKTSNFDEVSNFIGQGRQLDQEVSVAPRENTFEGYPSYSTVPRTGFTCADKDLGGYFADPEAECQVFHICMNGHAMGSFLCPNQTLFNQELFVCDWWYNVDCSQATGHYELNSRLHPSSDELL